MDRYHPVHHRGSLWPLSAPAASPMIFGLVVPAVGVALLLAGIFDGREATE